MKERSRCSELKYEIIIKEKKTDFTSLLLEWLSSRKQKLILVRLWRRKPHKLLVGM
jgi:hypothetical protein